MTEEVKDLIDPDMLREKYAHYRNAAPGTAVADLQDLLYRLEVLEEMEESE